MRLTTNDIKKMWLNQNNGHFLLNLLWAEEKWIFVLQTCIHVMSSDYKDRKVEDIAKNQIFAAN